MGEIAVVVVLVVFGVSVAEIGRRAFLGRQMEHAMSRLQTSPPQQLAWGEVAPSLERGELDGSVGSKPGPGLVAGSHLTRAS